jgi:hypothetical protein
MQSMKTPEILEMIRDDFPEVLTADGFDDAILGITEGWFDGSQRGVVCYDYNRCVEILVTQGCDEEEAEEYLQFNTLGAYMGEFTPVFLHHWRREDL